ncbi:MAG: recombinase family protein [Clostridia bacterium]|nr:recombinase family protein [Clostridia bacterium]
MGNITKMTLEKPVQNGKIRVAAYCRVSTDSSGQQHSYSAQKKYFTELYRNSETEELIKIYADSGSGTSTRYRPDMVRMLNDCKNGLIDRIVTKSVSRFARNTKECLCILRELKQLGVSVYFEKESIDTARMTDEIMITILEGLAQEESASISENIRWSLKKRMMNGTLTIARVPYGYKKVNKSLVIDEEKADTVKRIFNMYLSGNGAYRIAETLNSEGLPSPTGGKWNNITILKMLRQEKYTGDIHWQKTYSEFMGRKGIKNCGERDSYYIRDALPAIISRETLAAAETLRQNNTRKPKLTNSSRFRGKTKCVCGRSYYYTKSGRLPKWVCSGKRLPDKRCTGVSFYDKSLCYAWKRLCIKLRLFINEVLVPCIRQMKQLEARQYGGEENELKARCEELSDRRYVIYVLCSNGCITQEKAAQAELEINAELCEIENKLILSKKQHIRSAEKLTEIYETINKRTCAELADRLLVSAVTDGVSIEFELIGGIKLKEDLM